MKSELEQSLLDLFATYEGTILYVSHDIDEAFRFCDRIAVVSDGTIDEIAPKDELVHEPRSLAAIRLSGCKNTTPARYVSDHRVYLPEWGVEMETKRVVPHDVAWLACAPTTSSRRVKVPRHRTRSPMCSGCAATV